MYAIIWFERMIKVDEISKKRENPIRKSNALIQKSRHQLSLIEQKTILYVCSMIKSTDQELIYHFSITDYLKVCGFADGGRAYKDVKETLRKLRDTSWELKDENTGDWVVVSWLNKIKGNERKGSFDITIDEDLKPYLLNVNERFTQYSLINILGLTSGYAIHLYEILKSFAWTGFCAYFVDDFKIQFMIDKIPTYARWNDVKRKVIDVSINQINKFTDLNVIYMDNGKRGKKVTQFGFKIFSKNENDIESIKRDIHELLDTYKALPDEKIDKNLWEWLNENKKINESTIIKEEKQITYVNTYDHLIESYRNQLEYEIMKEQFPQDMDRIDEMIAVMVDFELSEAEYIKVDGTKRSKSVVVASYHKLKMEHIEYVLWCMNENTTSVRNIKAYLQTALYNAPMSMDNWISQRVQHDLYGKG